MDCIFCDIVKKTKPSHIIYEDEKVLAFKDLNPRAPIHVLVTPKKHITSANELKEHDKDLIGHIFLKIAEIADKLGCKSGYKILNNCGKDGGQTVPHIHFHILAGRSLDQFPC
ncbi:MAG: histidine triad nucleotide-binding protein [Oscillospiraceae bacterium]|jgi:histidine triad (HIT) family protein|nr:histidine triad nucleotide-binding protein [Oscillospiraceae bacterium]